MYAYAHLMHIHSLTFIANRCDDCPHLLQSKLQTLAGVYDQSMKGCL